MVTSYPTNKIWTFKSKINIVPVLSEAEFDADIGCNLNLTLQGFYKFDCGYYHGYDGNFKIAS